MEDADSSSDKLHRTSYKTWICLDPQLFGIPNKHKLNLLNKTLFNMGDASVWTKRVFPQQPHKHGKKGKSKSSSETNLSRKIDCAESTKVKIKQTKSFRRAAEFHNQYE